MAQQTAVEWLMQNIDKTLPNFIEAWRVEFEQAKKIEKEQITNAYRHGQNNGYMYRDGGSDIINMEHYYNETYGNEGV